MGKSNAITGVLLIISSLILSSCEKIQVDNPIQYVLENSDESAIRSVMDNLASHEVQIYFSRIDRSDRNIQFQDFTFQEEDSVYFYPASTVKLPVAVLALEKISEMDNFNLETRFYVEGDTAETTMAQEVVKVFAVSDNDANNRMFDFLGQDRINDRLSSMSVGPVRISHRLSTDNADDVTTRPLIVYLNDSTTTSMDITVNRGIDPIEMKGISKGNGFMDDDILIEESFDFSFKNYYSLGTQHEILKRLIFPEEYGMKETFRLGAQERELLLNAMWSPPRLKAYDEEEYYDGYCKFFMYGDTKERIPDNIKIYNKVGYAYGTLTDCAYIVDRDNDVEFFLTATILVNENGIFNDDHYEYESIGIPFLAALGRELYRFESKRK